MFIDNLIKKGSKILKEKNIPSSEIDSELLLSTIIKKDRIFVATNGDHEVSFKETSDFLNIISRRKKYEPLAYIMQKKEFWSLDFKVDCNVLIPRPETEIIVEKIVNQFKDKGSLSILDVGTGSGCILLSILKELTKSRGIGIDSSSKTLNIAKKNSKILNLIQRVKFIHCYIDNFNFGNYDVLVSNPPYICSHRIKYLSEDVKNFEPKSALDGGSSGLETINKVIIKARELLKVRGYLFLEIGSEQSRQVVEMLTKNNFRLVEKLFDYSKNVRGIMSTKLI